MSTRLTPLHSSPSPSSPPISSLRPRKRHRGDSTNNSIIEISSTGTSPQQSRISSLSHPQTINLQDFILEERSHEGGGAHENGEDNETDVNDDDIEIVAVSSTHPTTLRSFRNTVSTLIPLVSLNNDTFPEFANSIPSHRRDSSRGSVALNEHLQRRRRLRMRRRRSNSNREIFVDDDIGDNGEIFFDDNNDGESNINDNDEDEDGNDNIDGSVVDLVNDDNDEDDDLQITEVRQIEYPQNNQSFIHTPVGPYHFQADETADPLAWGAFYRQHGQHGQHVSVANNSRSMRNTSPYYLYSHSHQPTNTLSDPETSRLSIPFVTNQNQNQNQQPPAATLQSRQQQRQQQQQQQQQSSLSRRHLQRSHSRRQHTLTDPDYVPHIVQSGQGQPQPQPQPNARRHFHLPSLQRFSEMVMGDYISDRNRSRHRMMRSANGRRIPQIYREFMSPSWPHLARFEHELGRYAEFEMGFGLQDDMSEAEQSIFQRIEEDNNRILDERVQRESDFNKKYLKEKQEAVQNEQLKGTHTNTIKASETFVCELCAIVLGEGAPDDFKSDPIYDENFSMYVKQYKAQAPWFCVHPFTQVDIDLSKRVFVAKCGHTFCGRCVKNIGNRPSRVAKKGNTNVLSVKNPDAYQPRVCPATECGKKFTAKAFTEIYF